jgi:DNA-binding NarL/FixJ family response regulator
MDVLVVDDHPIVHPMLGAVAQAAMPEAIVHVESSLPAALAKAAHLDRLALVLLDLGLPDCPGIEALTRFRAAFPGVRVVVISATADAATVQAALDAGAAGFIPKTSDPNLIVAALRLVAAGGRYLPPEVVERPAGAGSPPERVRTKKTLDDADLGLTERQTEVLKLLARGLSNRQIAKQLRIAEDTVKQHTHALYRTLGVASRMEAFATLVRMGVKLD